MLRLLKTFCLLSCVLLAPAPAQAADKLRLVFDAWPPFSDATMVNGGLATELVTTALARAGYASDYQQVPWARAMAGVADGRYDIVVTAWYNEARTLFGQYSGGYLLNRIMFLRAKGSDIQYQGDYTDLHPYPIAVARGYAYSPGFDSDSELQKVPVQNFSLAVRMLAADRVKLTLEDELVARYYLARESPKVRDAVEFVPVPLTESRLRILVSLKNPQHEQIVAAFDREIAEMKADGTYDRLLKSNGM